MEKMQKIWLWVFGAMFVVPEIVFSFIVLSISNFLGKNFDSLYSLGIKANIFPNNSVYLFVALAIEWIGVLGLLITSIKLRKYIIAILVGMILIWLSLVFFYLYGVSNMGF